jgi:hypothetical protein
MLQREVKNGKGDFIKKNTVSPGKAVPKTGQRQLI